ncbi:helix-turn-helix domain-containing protein (plasmid) [Aeromonas caviae]|uniref:Helix-turn-helix domain-containing protein n=2 Tax=Aeromonas media TaxID=651 RepID=A0AAE6SI43_AERME|nr:helix-turn-helix domain-containing protein [Aeromonas media]QSO25201.1 helix-turn-helix domain-containing protein [Aeromonas caviae]
MTPEQVKQARLTLGLSQSQMCKALRLTSVMTYAKWEQGTAKPTASAAASIEMLLYMRTAGVLDGWIAKHANS